MKKIKRGKAQAGWKREVEMGGTFELVNDLGCAGAACFSLQRSAPAMACGSSPEAISPQAKGFSPRSLVDSINEYARRRSSLLADPLG